MPFDIEGARRSGWGDSEIVDYLRQQGSAFDADGARQAGYSDAEIAQFMSRGEGFSPSPYGALGAVPRGINTSLAGVVGAPVDLVNSGLGLIGLGSDEPFGGSASIRGALNTGVSGLAQALGGSGEYDATYESLSQLPPGERIGAVAGEVIGGSVPFAMAPVGLAAAGVQGPQWAQPIMNAAAQTPGRFLAAEAAAIGGASQGGALAEALAPGNEMARMGGEMAGAVLSPTSLATRAVGGISRTAQNIISSFTEGGRQRRAAEYVAAAFQSAGEDPAAVLEAIRRSRDLPAPSTVGQATGSPTVVAIENQLARQSPSFAADRTRLGREGREFLLESADRLVSSGNPDDLVSAARIRETAFNDMLQSRISAAEREAQEALARVGGSGQSGQVAASEEASSILSRAIDDSRSIETDLWSRIDRSVPIEPDAVLASYAQGRERLLPDESLNPAVEGIVARMMEGQPVTSNELLLLRSRSLEYARQATAGAEPDRAKASIYGMIADGALADLSSQMTGDAVDAARTYTRSMHEAFTQTFAGRGIASDRAGGDFIAPELLLERAFGGGGSRGDIQLGQLQAASEFPGSGLGPGMEGAQEDFLRSTAIARGVDPETGVARPGPLARFLAANETTFSRFPEAGADIAQALSTQRAAEGVRRRGEYATSVLGARSPFGRLLRGEEPVAAVRSSLRGAPQQYMSLVNTARRGGQEAVDGLASATLDALMRDARSSSGDFSFARFDQALNSRPVAWGRSSPMEVMVEQGVLDQGAAERLNEIIRRARLIESPPSASMDQSLIAAPDAVTDLISRIIGARIGSAGVAGRGAPLIAAGAGSRTSVNLFGRMPNNRIQQALIEIVKDPDLFEAAVSRARTPAERTDLNRQINAALINAGIDTGYEDVYDASGPFTSAVNQIPQITVQGGSDLARALMEQ